MPVLSRICNPATTACSSTTLSEDQTRELEYSYSPSPRSSKSKQAHSWSCDTRSGRMGIASGLVGLPKQAARALRDMSRNQDRQLRSCCPSTLSSKLLLDVHRYREEVDWFTPARVCYHYQIASMLFSLWKQTRVNREVNVCTWVLRAQTRAQEGEGVSIYPCCRAASCHSHLSKAACA